MKEQNYNTTITVDATPTTVFNRINDVAAWWSDDWEGHAQQVNDEFTVHFGDIHVSTQKVVELKPDQKVVWLVTDSKLNFIKDQQEWNNTTIVFDISPQDDKTQIHFTHVGLVPEVECYKNCVKGWDYYFKGSLFKLLTEGKGTPGL